MDNDPLVDGFSRQFCEDDFILGEGLEVRASLMQIHPHPNPFLKGESNMDHALLIAVEHIDLVSRKEIFIEV